MKRIACLLLIAFALTFTTLAQDDDHDKDHHHHEDLTETQLGTVHFPTSCSASVEKPFDRGVALLHSFWYEEAEKEFDDVAKDDPRCAMAHWGIAMSLWHQLWDPPSENVLQRGRMEVKAGQKLAIQATARERGYLSAASAFYKPRKLKQPERAKAYSDTMKKVYESNPGDHEAAAFYALSLLANKPDDNNFANRKAAAAILEKVFAIAPDHPGVAHYLIHAYDRPELAQLGIPAARRYAQIAPAAPHALHMPSHIFARVGLWQDDINSNLASVEATRKTAAMGMGGEDHQFHALDFLVYAYLQSGREAEAQKVVDEVKTMPSAHPMEGMGYDTRLSSLAYFEASYVMELHDWREAALLVPLSGVDWDYNGVIYLARALGAARSGQSAEARKEIEQVKAAAQAYRDKKRTGYADFFDRQVGEAQAWIAHSEGKDDEAIKMLRTITEMEKDGFSVTGFLPAQELLGDLLLEAKRPEEALAEYQIDLKINSNRFNGLYGAARAAESAGRSSDANKYYALLVKVCEGSSSTRPELNHARELLARK